MLPVPQVFRNRPEAFFASACVRFGAFCAMLALGGCGAGGFSLEQADVDRSIVTGSVPAASSVSGSDMTADQATIRNAVSSADIEEQAGKPLAWANPETGARGAITKLAQSKVKGRLCRSFDGSRENFDGVAMFTGRACMVGLDLWQIETFTVL